MTETTPTPSIENPPEHLQGNGPGDEAMYLAMRKHFGPRLNSIPSDVLLRFVRGYAHEDRRQEVTVERIQHFLDMSAKWDFPNLPDKPWADFDDCCNAWQTFMYGQNKFGHPIVYDRIGSGDLTLLREVFVTNMPPEKLKEYRYRIQLTFARIKRAQSLKYGKTIYQHDLIFDLAGFTAAHCKGADIRNTIASVLSDEQHLFPETVHKIYIINSPFVFRAAWRMISFFVDPLTYEKVKVLGKDFLSEVQKEISLDQIPREYGGVGEWEIRFGRGQTDELDELYEQVRRHQMDFEAKEGESEPEIIEMSAEDSAGAGTIEVSRSADSTHMEEN